MFPRCINQNGYQKVQPFTKRSFWASIICTLWVPHLWTRQINFFSRNFLHLSLGTNNTYIQTYEFLFLYIFHFLYYFFLFVFFFTPTPLTYINPTTTSARGQSGNFQIKIHRNSHKFLEIHITRPSTLHWVYMYYTTKFLSLSARGLFSV